MPPEHTHPAALEDCVTVTEHVIRQAHIHDFDPNRVAVVGDGAGGQLAAAVTLKVKRLIKIQVSYDNLRVNSSDFKATER